MNFRVRAIGCHLPYGITQVNTPCLNPSQRQALYLPTIEPDGRLSWSRLL